LGSGPIRVQSTREALNISSTGTGPPNIRPSADAASLDLDLELMKTAIPHAATIAKTPKSQTRKHCVGMVSPPASPQETNPYFGISAAEYAIAI
jgi:hypothetical protein